MLSPIRSCGLSMSNAFSWQLHHFWHLHWSLRHLITSYIYSTTLQIPVSVKNQSFQSEQRIIYRLPGNYDNWKKRRTYSNNRLANNRFLNVVLKTRGKKLKKRSFTKHWAIKLLSIRVCNSSVFCKEGKLCALNYVLLIQLIVECFETWKRLYRKSKRIHLIIDAIRCSWYCWRFPGNSYGNIISYLHVHVLESIFHFYTTSHRRT